MAYTVDIDINPELSDFMEQNVVPECEWANKEDVIGGYVTDLIGFLLGELEVRGDINVSVSFVTTERIHELNKKHRDIDSPTDVLSFPCDNPAEVPAGEPCELGDIVLAPEIAFKQSREYGNTYIQELVLLMTHSILHLLGYDHIEDGDAAKMEAKEKDLREAWEGVQ